MPAHLRLIWSADDPPLDAGAGVDGDTFINAREPISSPTSSRSPPPPCGEGKGWGAAQHSGSEWPKPPLSLVDNSAIANEAPAPHPNPSPQGGGAGQPPAPRRLTSLPALNRKRSRSGGGNNGGLSLRKLTALAILIAGLVIAAQALFIPVKAQAAQFLMHRAWTTQLTTGQPTRPWPWADFTPAARLHFPSQSKTVLALTDASGESLAFGPTLMAASATPGEKGIAVFAAHRDTHFAFLNRLQPGQRIDLDTGAKHLSFKVIGSSVVRWNASTIHPHDNGPPRLALVTCWPLDSQFHGPWRYVVWAEMVEAE